MIRAYALLIIGLQIFCLYHAYKNNTAQKWLWLIILLPLAGSLIYLYYHFFNQKTIDVVSETATKVINSNHRVEQLQKEVKFSNTVANKILLAEEYLNIEAYDRAVDLYESCLIGTHSDDTDILLGLVKSNYLAKNYEATINYAEQLGQEAVFLKSPERIAYAWALFNTGKKEKAEENFLAMDHQFSNYKHRLEYCNFLIEENRSSEAKRKLKELMNEIELMDRPEQRLNRSIFNIIKSLHTSIG